LFLYLHQFLIIYGAEKALFIVYLYQNNRRLFLDCFNPNVGVIITLSRQEQCTQDCCPQSYVGCVFVQTLQVSPASNHSTICSYSSLTVSEVCVPASTIITPPFLWLDILLSVLDQATANEAYRLTIQTSLLTQANELTRAPVSVF
jgi:hypothetical protein